MEAEKDRSIYLSGRKVFGIDSIRSCELDLTINRVKLHAVPGH